MPAVAPKVKGSMAEEGEGCRTSNSASKSFDDDRALVGLIVVQDDGDREGGRGCAVGGAVSAVIN